LSSENSPPFDIVIKKTEIILSTDIPFNNMVLTLGTGYRAVSLRTTEPILRGQTSDSIILS